MLYWSNSYLKSSFIGAFLNPPSVVVENVASRVCKFYKSILELTPDQEKLISDATQYVSYVLPAEYGYCRRIIEALTLWLSLHWIADKDDFSLIVNRLVYHQPIEFILSESQGLIYTVYAKYLLLIDTYQQTHAQAFDRVIKWELNTVSRKDVSYHQWTLAQNPVMGLIYNVFLVTQTPLPKNVGKLKLLGLMVCYHQDLLGFKKDLHYGNSNIVRLMTNDNYMQGYYSTINLIEHMYIQIRIAVHGDFTIACLVKQFLEGSYKWTSKQIQYQQGLEILKAVQDDDSTKFYLELADV